MRWRTRGSDRSAGRARSSDAGILPHALATSDASDGRLDRHVVRSLSRRRERMPPRRPRRPRPAARRGRGRCHGRGHGQSSLHACGPRRGRRRRRRQRRDGDDDATFTVVAGLTERPRALALGADGAAIVADDDGVLVIGGDGATERILDRPTDAVAVCGGVALALADDGVYRWTPGAAPVRTSDRPPVRGIACGPTGEARWIATGLGVWTSPDGATWTERTETLGRRVAGAATVGERVWLAIDNGLVAFDPTAEEHGPDRRSPGRSMLPTDAAAGFAPIPTRHLVAPTLPWPEVTALFGVARTPDRRSWQVMLLLTFPLGRGRRPARRSDGGGGRERAPRPGARARTDRPRRRGRTSDDEVDDGEREARLDSVRQEREALR